MIDRPTPDARPDYGDVPRHLIAWVVLGTSVYFGIIALTMILAAIASAR